MLHFAIFVRKRHGQGQFISAHTRFELVCDQQSNLGHFSIRRLSTPYLLYVKVSSTRNTVRESTSEDEEQKIVLSSDVGVSLMVRLTSFACYWGSQWDVMMLATGQL